MPCEMPLLDQLRKMFLERVPAGSGKPDDLSHGGAAMLPDVFDDLDGEAGKRGNTQLLALNLNSEPALLLLQRTQEEEEPWLPVRNWSADRRLGLPECKVVGLLAVLDDAFKRAVGHVSISGLQQKKRGQHSAQTSVAVLERMDFKKDDREDADQEQGVELVVFSRLVKPIDQLGHQLRRIEGRGRLEDDADLSSLLIDGGNTVRQLFVLAAMPSVLPVVTKKIPVELLDVILAERQVLPRAKDGLHGLGVAGYFLLITAGERSDFEIRQQPLDLSI